MAILATVGLQVLVCRAAIPGEMSPREVLAERNARPAVHDLCKQAMRDIRADLAGLVGRFSVLDGISRTNIVCAEPQPAGAPTWEHHYLRYYRNVTIKRTGPFLPTGEIHTVEKDGAKLEIYLLQGDVKIARVGGYALPYGAGDNQLRLIYNLEANPPDPSLDKALREVIEKRVALLEKALQAR